MKGSLGMSKQNVYVLVDASGLVLGVRAQAHRAFDYVDERKPLRVNVHLQKLTTAQIEIMQRNEAGRCFATL
jgi:hypothetical protein